MRGKPTKQARSLEYGEDESQYQEGLLPLLKKPKTEESKAGKPCVKEFCFIDT